MKFVAIVIECRKCSRVNRLILSDGTRGRPLCGSCRSGLSEFRVVNPFVYVLSHMAMPGLLKIGCTERTVEDRVRELNTATGVPVPFSIEAYFPAQDTATDECAVHDALAHRRVPDKEFFALNPVDAVDAIATVLKRRPLYVKADARAGSMSGGDTQS